MERTPNNPPHRFPEHKELQEKIRNLESKRDDLQSEFAEVEEKLAERRGHLMGSRVEREQVQPLDRTTLDEYDKADAETRNEVDQLKSARDFIYEKQVAVQRDLSELKERQRYLLASLPDDTPHS